MHSILRSLGLEHRSNRMPSFQRRRPPQASLSWVRKPPTQEGWYWYRDANRDEVVLRVFDPLGNKHWKAWDWQDGRLMLYSIAEYQGEWYGPLEVPK